jgi:hypothetical protein
VPANLLPNGFLSGATVNGTNTCCGDDDFNYLDPSEYNPPPGSVPPSLETANALPPLSPDNIAINDSRVEWGYDDGDVTVCLDVSTSGRVTLVETAQAGNNFVERYTLSSSEFAGCRIQPNNDNTNPSIGNVTAQSVSAAGVITLDLDVRFTTAPSNFTVSWQLVDCPVSPRGVAELPPGATPACSVLAAASAVPS